MPDQSFSRRGRAAAVLAVGVLVAGAALVAPAHAADARPAAATVTFSPFTGLSDGTIVYANALHLPSADLANAEIAQSAAGTSRNATLARTDQLGVPVTTSKTATSFGHGAGVNVGLGQSQSVPGQVQLSQADATDPGTHSATSQLLTVPIPPLLTADVLPSSANVFPASTATTCPADGTVLSTGTAHVANATALSTAGISVLKVGGTVQNTSTTQLVKAASGQGLLTRTVSQFAPITLFAGTPAELTLDVLTPIALTTVAGGSAGSASVTYGAVQTAGGIVTPVGASTPVLTITAGGMSQTLTSQQVFGNGGIVLPLGIADVTIGAPAHALTGLEGSNVSVAADGTSASAAADLVRVTVPGSLKVPSTNPVGGPLGTLLNPVLNPVLSGLSPVLSALQSQLTAAGLGVADVRVGHLEASATVPAGGIICTPPTTPTTNPLGESVKDVSASTVVPGQTFTYDIRVPNRGDQDVTNVVVKDTYASGLEFVSSVPTPTSQSGNTLTYDLGTIAPNAFQTIVLTFRVPADATAGTKYSNHADITGTYVGLPVTQTVDVSGPTVGAPFVGGCRLTDSTKYASNTQVKTGENFGYFINVLNDGNAPCDNVQVSDTLVSGVTFVSCTSSCTHSGQDVSWSLGTLASGQSEVLAVIVKTTATSGTLPNTAHITSASGGSGNPATVGPTVSGESVPAPGVPAGCTGNCPATAVLGNSAAKTLAFTGLSSGVPLLAALLALGGATGLVLRRRRARD